MTIAFNVGVTSQAFYEAPGWIKPLIQIGNRIDPAFVCVFYILASSKRPISDLKASLLMVTLGFLRAGMGAFFYIIIALIIKYRLEWVKIIRRYLLVVVLLLLATPFLLSALYDFRALLRGDAVAELALFDLVFAKIAGRLSSYSNFLYILQEAAEFQSAALSLSAFYYPLQIAGGIFAGSLAPVLTPEKLLIDVNLFYDGHSTYMAGVLGNLLLAWFISPLVAILNLALMLFMIVLILKVSYRFGNGSASSVGFGMLLYPLTSGVSYEFAILLLNCIVFYLLCRVMGGMHYLSNMPSVNYGASNRRTVR